MTLTIGLTGGIGSGKSTVAKLFSELGIPVFDTDIIARELVQPGKPTLNEIISIFGKDIIDSSGALNREKLKQRIFTDDDARKTLEDIIHPKIRENLLAEISACSAPYCIAVIPLLFEKNWQKVVDRVLVVDLPEDTQLERAKSRDNVSKEIVRQIMQTQCDRNTRLGGADDTIDNSGDQKQLLNQVSKLHRKYLELASKI